MFNEDGVENGYLSDTDLNEHIQHSQVRVRPLTTRLSGPQFRSPVTPAGGSSQLRPPVTPLSGSSLYNERMNTNTRQPMDKEYECQEVTHQQHDPSLIAMLQHQQSLLQKVISQQESMSEKQKRLDEKL